MIRNEELLSVIGLGVVGFGLILFMTIVTYLPEVY